MHMAKTHEGNQELVMSWKIPKQQKSLPLEDGDAPYKMPSMILQQSFFLGELCGYLSHYWLAQEDIRGAVKVDWLTGQLISYLDYFRAPYLDSLEIETVPTGVISWIPLNMFVGSVFHI